MCERCVVTSSVAAPVVAQLELVALPGEEKASVPPVLAPGRRAIDLVHRELRK
jgi:hypothetical protein